MSKQHVLGLTVAGVGLAIAVTSPWSSGQVPATHPLPARPCCPERNAKSYFASGVGTFEIIPSIDDPQGFVVTDVVAYVSDSISVNFDYVNLLVKQDGVIKAALAVRSAVSGSLPTSYHFESGIRLDPGLPVQVTAQLSPSGTGVSVTISGYSP